MYGIVEFFEPSDASIWLLKTILLCLVSYFVLWLFALMLSRVRWFDKGGVTLRVCFGWLILLALHSIASTVFLLFSAKHYKELGVSLWFCAAYLVPIFLNGFLGIDLSMRIRKRVKEV